MAEEFDLDLPAGRVHAQRFGREGAPLVLAVMTHAETAIALDALIDGAA